MLSNVTASGNLARRSHAGQWLPEAVPPRAMEMRAAVRINADSHLKPYAVAITYRYNRRKLTLAGLLPSFYHKQLAQEVLRDMEGVDSIENRIEVKGATTAETHPVLRSPHFPSPSRRVGF